MFPLGNFLSRGQVEPAQLNAPNSAHRHAGSTPCECAGFLHSLPYRQPLNPEGVGTLSSILSQGPGNGSDKSIQAEQWLKGARNLHSSNRHN